MNEHEIRLETISEMIDNAFNTRMPMLLSTAQLLENIQMIALGVEGRSETPNAVPPTAPAEKIEIFCVYQNEDEHASGGVVIKSPDPAKNMAYSMPMPSLDTQEGTLDIIYSAISNFFGTTNNPGVPVVIKSNQLDVMKEFDAGEPVHTVEDRLVKKVELIEELLGQLPVSISFEWRPANSSREMAVAEGIRPPKHSCESCVE